MDDGYESSWATEHNAPLVGTLDETLRERLLNAASRNALRSLAWFAVALVYSAGLVLAWWLAPHTSSWLLPATILGGVPWGLALFHRSMAKTARRLSNTEWVEEHEGNSGPSMYGLFGIRFYLN